jgi:hypothetical protein
LALERPELSLIPIPVHWSNSGAKGDAVNPFYAIDPELFDFHLNRFSFGEATKEAIKKENQKVSVPAFFLMHKMG